MYGQLTHARCTIPYNTKWYQLTHAQWTILCDLSAWSKNELVSFAEAQEFVPQRMIKELTCSTCLSFLFLQRATSTWPRKKLVHQWKAFFLISHSMRYANMYMFAFIIFLLPSSRWFSLIHMNVNQSDAMFVIVKLLRCKKCWYNNYNQMAGKVDVHLHWLIMYRVLRKR